MGWSLWSSPSASKQSPSSPTGTSTSSTSRPSFTSTYDSHPEDLPKDVPSRTLSRDEAADQELKEFLNQVTTESGPASTSTSSSHQLPASSSPISSDSLYPTSMSCTSAFDSAFYCQSMGGQFINVYRYGGIKDCSEHWNAFWFCMRNKSYPDEEKAKRVQEFYREKAAKYKIGPSSEDVWKVREEPIVGAFSLDPDAEERAERVERVEAT